MNMPNTIKDHRFCLHRMIVPFKNLMVTVFLLFSLFNASAWADVTIAYDLFGDLLKPSVAANSTTGDILVVYLSPQTCDGTTAYDEARAT